MSDLYVLRSTPTGYRITKLDDDLTMTTVYEMVHNRYGVQCSCFQANKPTCRHRKMVELFVARKRVDKGWFYDYDTGRWLKPVKC